MCADELPLHALL